MAYCIDCDQFFDRTEDEYWKVRCYACYIKKKEKREDSSQARRIRELEAELGVWRDRYYDALIDVPSKIIYDNINFLLMVCHPDRNPNRPEAHEVTKWLISIRKELVNKR